MAKIAIIGGGIAGCTTALKLSEIGHDISILEKNTQILQGTSARTPGRMGLGYHYFDFETAKLYMEQTVKFIKQYPDCFLGFSESQSHLQNGRYFIVKDSLVGHQDLMATFDRISHEFESMVSKDRSNNVFGTTHLHRSLKVEEYKDDVDATKVAFAIETKERLLDWDRFSKSLEDEILQKANISILTDFEVAKPEITADGNFLLTNKNDSSILAEYDYVVNCTWQNIEFINQKLGIGKTLRDLSKKKRKSPEPDKSEIKKDPSYSPKREYAIPELEILSSMRELAIAKSEWKKELSAKKAALKPTETEIKEYPWFIELDEFGNQISPPLVAKSGVVKTSEELAQTASEKLFPNDESQRKIPERILRSFFISHIKRSFTTREFVRRRRKKSPGPEPSNDKSKTTKVSSPLPKKDYAIPELEILSSMKKAVIAKGEWTEELSAKKAALKLTENGFGKQMPNPRSSTSAEKTLTEDRSRGNR